MDFVQQLLLYYSCNGIWLRSIVKACKNLCSSEGRVNEKMDKDFLNDVYKDFFGPGGKDPVKNAEDALKEAEKMLADLQKRNQAGIDALEKEVDAVTGTDTVENVEEMQAVSQTEQQEAPKEPEKDPMEQLDELIGLAEIKHDVLELTDFVKVQKMRKDQGMKSVPVSLHLVFTGNPGTGKTTVARILAKLYANIGALSKGQLVEVDRSGLVAGYVGQTALKTQEKIREALGGVLFIDEAYALSQKDDAFGQEAIDTILKAMEDHRDDLVVIVAGYTKPMEEFINSNPGLKSRFNKYIEFPDYSVDELEEIFYSNCSRYDYVVEEEAKKHIREMIVARKMQKQENFANAREVRNLFEEIITNQARRVAELESPSQEEMMLLKLEDLTEEISDGDKEQNKQLGSDQE
ncbi:MAG: AAA family ATPase [Eubacterium sp.]|nr:AAA family ATPase [Eubacterium sp.]